MIPFHYYQKRTKIIAKTLFFTITHDDKCLKNKRKLCRNIPSFAIWFKINIIVIVRDSPVVFQDYFGQQMYCVSQIIRLLDFPGYKQLF